MKYALISAAAALVFAAFSMVRSSANTTMVLHSDAFADGATLPQVYSCNGKGISPQLSWTGAPAKTKSFALTVFDPDARAGAGFWHWVLYNIPADTSSLVADVHGAGLEGPNSTGKTGYVGACPPPGDKPHHYVFTLFALDVTLTGKLDGTHLNDAINNHVLARAELVGRFGR